MHPLRLIAASVSTRRQSATAEGVQSRRAGQAINGGHKVTISIRSARASDIPDALQLCRSAGWNQRESDWLRLYQFEPDGCFSATSQGKLVGTVTTTCYGRQLAWIGMMLVHESYRRQGIATRLMNRALEYLNSLEIQCTRLDATPEGSLVYKKLGFIEEYAIERWLRPGTLDREPPGHRPDSPSTKTAISADDIRWIDQRQALREYDGETFGADRWDWIEVLIPDSVVRCHGQAMGMLRPGYLASYLGPLIAAKTEDSRAVVAELVGSTPDPIFWDIPIPNKAAAKLASELEFQVVRKLIRMRLGPTNAKSVPQRLFALADPSTG